MTHKILDPGHYYGLEDGQTIQFIKRTNGELVTAGTTNEELLEVIIDRTKFLNEKFPCIENDTALYHLAGALHWFNERTKLRVTQGVETKDIAHVTPDTLYLDDAAPSSSDPV